MKRLLIAIAMVMLLSLVAVPAAADTVIDVYPGDSIQAAVDAASPGDTVLVHAGTYNQSVVFGPEDSGITLRGEAGAILDGTGLAAVDGIKLLAGVSDVTIEGFEIRNYTGTGNGQGNAIQAWNSGTSNIRVENNVMHDNSWNAVLVGNEGTGLHDGWKIEGNDIYGNGAYSLEVTNGKNARIYNNKVRGGWVSILVQARNTIPDSGMFTVENVQVSANEVAGPGIGIYILSLASQPLPPFDPILGAQATLKNVKVSENVVGGIAAPTYGILVWGYLNGGVEAASVDHNSVSDSSVRGIYVSNASGSRVSDNSVSGTSGGPGIQLVQVSNSAVMKNTVNGNERGIVLTNSDGNDLRENTASSNTTYGIRLISDSDNNTIMKNTALSNGIKDLFQAVGCDNNVWKDNTFGTSEGI